MSKKNTHHALKSAKRFTIPWQRSKCPIKCNFGMKKKEEAKDAMTRPSPPDVVGDDHDKVLSL